MRNWRCQSSPVPTNLPSRPPSFCRLKTLPGGEDSHLQNCRLKKSFLVLHKKYLLSCIVFTGSTELLINSVNLKPSQFKVELASSVLDSS